MKKSIRMSIVACLIGAFAMANMGEAAGAQAQMIDYETVFVVLGPDGKGASATLVDWIRSPKGGPASIFDPGQLGDVKNLRGPEVPSVGSSGVKWMSDPSRLTDINYSGVTSKTLPVSIKVRYSLNGRDVKPSEAPGASGKLEIRMDLANNTMRSQQLSYVGADGKRVAFNRDVFVPMVVQISTDVMLPEYSRIDAPGAATVLVGKTLKATWMLFPNPDASATLLLEGQNMQPGGFDVSIIPTMPPIPMVDITGQLRELANGADKLDGGLAEAKAGAAKLSDGQIQLGDGIASLRSGAGDLVTLASVHLEIARTMNAALSDPAGSGIRQLAELADADRMIISRLAEGVSALPIDQLDQAVNAAGLLVAGLSDADAGAQSLSRALASYSQVVSSAKSANGEAASALETLARSNPGIAKTPEYAALAAAVRREESIITTAQSGGTVGLTKVSGISTLADSAKALASSTGRLKFGVSLAVGQLSRADEVKAQFMQARDALNAVSHGGEVEGRRLPGMDVLCDGIRRVDSGMGELVRGIGLLADGGTLDGHSVPGIGVAVDALSQLSAGIDKLSAGSADLKAGSAKLSSGLAQMRDEGTSRMKTEVNKGLAEALRGQAEIAAMENRLAEYDTFAGKPEGARGEVRFLIKIKAPSQEQ
ncbi:MAG: hypothetical protein VB144_11000 [Clostridia bacterium]|nr:hypothetical protein [Clostridia bacterium]